MSFRSATAPSVHAGIWTDWTYGRIMGGTITMSSGSGALLVAFLALFVRLAGNHFWDVMCFSFFWIRTNLSKGKARDGLWHQQQALLRNKQTDGSFAFEALRAGWAWRKVVPRPLWRSLPLVLTAALHLGLFMAAAIFSSKVTAVQSYVLLNEVSCGGFPMPDLQATPESLDYYAVYGSYVRRLFLTASNYAASCYGTSLSDTSWEDCNALGRQHLQWSTHTNIPCPFAPEMCLRDLAVRLDSGLIDSHLQLGINAPRSDRIGYRQVTECAPIVQDGYVKGPMSTNETNINPIYLQWNTDGELWWEYHYGANNRVWPATFIKGNDSYIPEPGQLTQWADYELMLNVYFPEASSGDASNTFIPIPQLRRPDADIVLIALDTGVFTPVFYRKPVNDPWFNGTLKWWNEFEVEQNNGSSIFFNSTWYTTPNPLNILGCTFQSQWCNTGLSDEPQCTPLQGTGGQGSGGAGSIENIGTKLRLNANQRATLQRMYPAAFLSQIRWPLEYLGSDILLAHQLPYHLMAYDLPDDQWVREVSQISGTALVAMQLQMLEWVTGDGDPSHNKYQDKPLTKAGLRMCKNQIMQTPHYSSFNIFGLCIILIFGGLFILANFLISNVLSANLRIRFLNEDRRISWNIYSSLQLQRMALESRAIGNPWSGQQNIVPVAAHGAKWPPLGLTTDVKEKSKRPKLSPIPLRVNSENVSDLEFNRDFSDDIPPDPEPAQASRRWPSIAAKFCRRTGDTSQDTHRHDVENARPRDLSRSTTTSGTASVEEQQIQFKKDDFRDEIPPNDSSQRPVSDPGQYPSRFKFWKQSDRFMG